MRHDMYIVDTTCNQHIEGYLRAQSIVECRNCKGCWHLTTDLPNSIIRALQPEISRPRLDNIIDLLKNFVRNRAASFVDYHGNDSENAWDDCAGGIAQG